MLEVSVLKICFAEKKQCIFLLILNDCVVDIRSPFYFKVDPKKRITVENIIKHDWMSQESRINSKPMKIKVW